MALISVAELAELPSFPMMPGETGRSALRPPCQSGRRRPVAFAASVAVARDLAWRPILRRALTGTGTALVLGEGPVTEGWRVAIPSGTRAVWLDAGEGVFAALDRILARDRHGEIAAILVAIPGEDATAATHLLRGVAAVVRRAFHDALILVDWQGSEDSALAGFSEADAVVLEASDWAPGAEGPRAIFNNATLAS